MLTVMQRFDSYELLVTPEQGALLRHLASAQMLGLRGALPRCAQRMMSEYAPNIPDDNLAYRIDRSGWRVTTKGEGPGLFLTVRQPGMPGQEGYAEANRIYIRSKVDITFQTGYTRGRLWIVSNKDGRWFATVWRKRIGDNLDFPHPAGGRKRYTGRVGAAKRRRVAGVQPVSTSRKLSRTSRGKPQHRHPPSRRGTRSN